MGVEKLKFKSGRGRGLGRRRKGVGEEQRCGNCQRTSRTCTRESWEEGDLCPPVRSDIDEEEEVEDGAVEEEAEEGEIGGEDNIAKRRRA